MTTIKTTPCYNEAFWNLHCGRPYDAAAINSIGADAMLGLPLPDESAAKFRTEQEKTNVFRKIGRVIRIESFGNKIKTVPPSGEAAFVDDDTPYPESTVGIAFFHLGVHRIVKIAKVSNEMIKDAGFDLESALAADFGREFGKTEEEACINGSGERRPYGLLHPTDGAETGVTATTLAFDDVKALYFSLEAHYRRNAAWLMSDETAFALRTMKDSTGNYLWRDSDDTIFGKPVYTSPYMPGATSGNSPVLFGDFSFLWLLERGSVSLMTLRERYVSQGAIGFVGTEIIDSRLTKREAVKALAIE